MENTVTIFGHTLEHIVSARAFGTPVTSYRVTTEDGYYIHTARMGELEYKTVTFIYATDDFSAIEIVAEADLPEDAVICGGETPKPEIM